MFAEISTQSAVSTQGWWMYLALLVALLAFLSLKHWLRAVYLALNLPGPPALPLIGNILLIGNNTRLIKLGRTVYKDYGSIFRGWLSVIPIIIVLEPKYIQTILGSAKFTDKNFLYSLMHTFIGEGMITNSGEKWKTHRKYVQPFFNLNILKLFVQTFAESSDVMVDALKGKEVVQVTTFVNSCVLDILHQAILGIPLNDNELKNKSPFRKGHITLLKRILKPWLLFDFAYNLTTNAKSDCTQKLTLQTFSRKILKECKRKKKLRLDTQFSLLEFLIEVSENNPDFSEEDIVNEVTTFMLAGQDSVGAAICFTLYYLAKHQDVQEKVVEELRTAFLNTNIVTMEILNEMKYLEQCIKEAMRLCPSVPIIARKLSEDIKLGDYTIPVGCNIFIAPFATHRVPQYYPEPEKFDPDRFSERNNRSHPFAYLSFSAGPRNCIGYKFALLEMKTVISTLMRNYRMYLAPGYELQLAFRITLRAKGGIWLKLEPRSDY